MAQRHELSVILRRRKSSTEHADIYKKGNFRKRWSLIFVFFFAVLNLPGNLIYAPLTRFEDPLMAPLEDGLFSRVRQGSQSVNIYLSLET